MIEVLANATMAIILQYRNVSNEQVVHLKLYNAIIPLYLNKKDTLSVQL